MSGSRERGESEPPEGEDKKTSPTEEMNDAIEAEKNEDKETKEQELSSKYENWDCVERDWSPEEKQQQEWELSQAEVNEYSLKDLESIEKGSPKLEQGASTRASPSSDENEWKSSLLTFCGISLAAIIGVFTRIGFGYYKIWSIETNYVSSLLRPSLVLSDLSVSVSLTSRRR
jgi:hypothetical protein